MERPIVQDDIGGSGRRHYRSVGAFRTRCGAVTRVRRERGSNSLSDSEADNEAGDSEPDFQDVPSYRPNKAYRFDIGPGTVLCGAFDQPLAIRQSLITTAPSSSAISWMSPDPNHHCSSPSTWNEDVMRETRPAAADSGGWHDQPTQISLPSTCTSCVSRLPAEVNIDSHGKDGDEESQLTFPKELWGVQCSGSEPCRGCIVRNLDCVYDAKKGPLKSPRPPLPLGSGQKERSFGPVSESYLPYEKRPSGLSARTRLVDENLATGQGVTCSTSIGATSSLRHTPHLHSSTPGVDGDYSSLRSRHCLVPRPATCEEWSWQNREGILMAHPSLAGSGEIEVEIEIFDSLPPLPPHALPSSVDSVVVIPSPLAPIAGHSVHQKIPEKMTRESMDVHCDTSSSEDPDTYTLPKGIIVDKVMRFFVSWLDRKLGINNRARGGEAGVQDRRDGAGSGQALRANAGPGESGRPVRQARGVGRKHRSDETDGEDDDEDDGKGRRKKRRDLGTDDEGGDKMKLACPFFKHNPRRYKQQRPCCGPGWDFVHRIKEHLYRKHALPRFTCHRCCQPFNIEDELQAHARATVPCQIQEPQPLDGFTQAQEKKLRSRKKTAVMGAEDASEAEKWRQMYRILFPDVREEEIPSPYYEDTDISGSNLKGYEDYLRRELPPMVRRQLEQEVERELNFVEEGLKRRVIDMVRNLNLSLLRSYRQLEEAETAFGRTELERSAEIAPEAALVPDTAAMVPAPPSPELGKPSSFLEEQLGEQGRVTSSVGLVADPPGILDNAFLDSFLLDGNLDEFSFLNNSGETGGGMGLDESYSMVESDSGYMSGSPEVEKGKFIDQGSNRWFEARWPNQRE